MFTTNAMVPATIAGIKRIIKTAPADVVIDRLTSRRERLNASRTVTFSSIITGGTIIHTTCPARNPPVPAIMAPMPPATGAAAIEPVTG